MVAMETSHRDRLRDRFGRAARDLDVRVLHIEDDYAYQDPELVERLIDGVRAALSGHSGAVQPRRALSSRGLASPIPSARPACPAVGGLRIMDSARHGRAGAIAQLVERCNRTAEVSGSTPLSSTPQALREGADAVAERDWSSSASAT